MTHPHNDCDKLPNGRDDELRHIQLEHARQERDLRDYVPCAYEAFQCPVCGDDIPLGEAVCMSGHYVYP